MNVFSLFFYNLKNFFRWQILEMYYDNPILDSLR